MTRGWGYMERYAQRTKLWPDGLKWMASGAPLESQARRFVPGLREAPVAQRSAG